MQRLVPPAAAGNPATITVNGRYYSCAIGAALDVPDQDAFLMLANGWLPAAGGVSGGDGTTAQRPSNPVNGTGYYDATLGKGIVFDGASWIDPDTGAIV